MVLRTLPEELLEFNSDVIDSRRRDILEGMKTALDTLFPFFAQVRTSHSPSLFLSPARARLGHDG